MNESAHLPDLKLLSRLIPNTPSIGSTTVTTADHIHLSFGFAAPNLFPLAELEKAATDAITVHGREALQYSGAPGPAYIARWIEQRARQNGIEATPNHVLVTYGATQGLALAAQLLIEPGDEVWTEAPTFFSALQAFRLSGAIIRSFPLEADGLNVELLAQALRQQRAAGRPLPKLLYTMPTYHNPGGVTLSLAKRQRLVELAREYHFYVLEDDAYGELNFTGQLLPTLYSLAPERTIYLNTFSKIIAPGLRLGWMIAHPQLIDRLRILMLGGSTGVFTQEIVAALLQHIDFEQHVERLRTYYRQQRDVMATAIDRYFGDTVRYVLPDGGFFLWLSFRPEIDTTELQQRALHYGVSIVDGRSFYPERDVHHQLRLCFSYCSAEQIEQGIARLATAYTEQEEQLGQLNKVVSAYAAEGVNTGNRHA
ncbi:PLP-dependent aminotransferase family protein [Paenibacillus campi]|uniref:aminotransferase-like domain-containing protein n=1 Tax=Paenibacillus campi TaxID=3106031 RepID=UPI002AFE04CB|nr:PLP-dependent aminotransferase family protein [Paenibacillus sp. SGZ-1009]